MEDERLAAIKQEQQAALESSKGTYDQMFKDNENWLNQQNEIANQFEQTQNETLDKQLEFYKQNIEKQKETARQNKETEALKAENDYLAQTNPYGYQAETLASKGQLNSGLSQTMQLGAYGAYQNRLASANKVMQDAFTQYDLDMNEAILNNDVQKAQNALARLEMMLGYNETFMNNKMNLTQNQLSNQQQLDSEYYNRYQNMINQINYEKEQAEKIRQYEQNLAYQKERDKVADTQWENEYNLAKKKVTSGGGNTPYNIPQDSGKDYLGNSAETQNRADFYADNGYQPAYIDNKRVQKSGFRVWEVFDAVSKAFGNQNIWEANGKFYVWEGNGNKGGEYIDVTEEVKNFKKSKATTPWR